MKKRALTGVQPTNFPHIGNIFGSILPAIQLQETHEAFYFIANYHSLTTVENPQDLRNFTYEVAAFWLALGLDPDKATFYRQSDVPEVTELSWILSNSISMGDLFRAHSFKAAKDEGREGELLASVFSYPVLMAADILAFQTDVVPVGKDQVQHIEITRAIAKRFNFHFGDTFKEPQEKLQAEVAVVPGIDGRKMSKSYNNGIVPFLPPKQLKQQVMAIVTDSKGLEEPKDPTTCNIFALYKLFSTQAEQDDLAAKYRAGNFGYGHAKLALLEKIEQRFGPHRETYQKLRADEKTLNAILEKGAAKARPIAREVLNLARKKRGIDG